MSDTYKIHLQTSYDPSGIDGAIRGTEKLNTSIAGLKNQAAGFSEFFKQGLGIDIASRSVSVLADLSNMLKEAVSRGVAFNVEMFNSEKALANVLQQQKNLNAEAARGEAGKAMAQIVELEPKTAGTLSSLVQGFMATVASAHNAGMSIEQNIDLVGQFANALANANIPAEQLSQELRSIFTGNIGADSALARQLNISNADVAKWKEAGTLFEELSKKIGTMGEAGDSFAVRWSSLQSAIDKSLAQMTRPIFDALFESLETLTQELNKPEVAQAFESLGVQIATIVEAGAELLAWAIENAPALAAMAQAGITLTAVLSALAAVKMATTFVSWASALNTSTAATGGQTAATIRNAAAIQAETVAVAANTAAQKANAASRGASWSAPFLGGAKQAGMTSTAKYAANRIGGVVTGAAGSSAALSGSGLATGAASVGSLPAMVLAVSGALGVALGKWADAAIIEPMRRARAEALKLDASGRDAQTEMQGLRDRRGDVDSTSQAGLERDIRKQIVREQFQIANGDKVQANLAAIRLEELEGMLEGMGETIALNDSLIEQEKRRTEEVEKRAKAEQEAAIAAARAASFEAAAPILRDAQNREALNNASSPEERAAVLSRLSGESRQKFNNLALGESAGAVSPNAGQDELFGAANRAVTANGAKELAALAAEILGYERELQQISEERGNAVEEQMAKEVESFQKRQELLIGLQEELAIQKAITAGHDSEARLLEIQRDLRKQLADIASQDLAPAEAQRAQDLATQTAEMQKQKVLAEQAKKQEDAWAKASELTGKVQPGFDEKLRGGRGARARAKDRSEFLSRWDSEAGKALNEAGVDSAAIARAREGAGLEYDRAARDKMGRFGNTTRSERDQLGNGLTDSDQWRNQFSGGVRGGTMLDADGTQGGFGGGKTPESDWNAIFKRNQPLSDAVATSPANANQNGKQGAVSGGADSGAKAVENAGQEVSKSARELARAASSLQHNVQSAMRELGGSMSSLANTISNQFSVIADQIDELERTVSML